MSTIRVIDNTYQVSGSALAEAKALILLDTQAEALADLIYGTTTRPVGFAPPHDHAGSGGESLLEPILSHSFGEYNSSFVIGPLPGVHLFGPVPTGNASTQPTFGPVTTDGVVDHSGAKRLYSSIVTIPGGVLGVRVSVLVRNTNLGTTLTLPAVFRPLSCVNFKLGESPLEVRGDISVDLSGAGSNIIYNFSANVASLAALGNCSKDQELEFSLWLATDQVEALTPSDLLCHTEIIPRYFTTARQPQAGDLQQPRFAIRETQTGVGNVTPVLGSKLKALYNGLNRALWGSGPGLLPDGTPDTRRRFLETIDDVHRHQGLAVPDIDGTVFSDGAVLADHQSFGFVQDEGEGASGYDYDSAPVKGRYLHTSASLASGWTNFSWRRSIPSGLGALLMRFGVMPFTATRTATLLVRVSIVPVDGSGEIVVKTECGPFESESDSGHTDFQYCELAALDDPAYLSSLKLSRAPLMRPWNTGVQISANALSAGGFNSVLYRLSQPLLVTLTHPPSRPLDVRHPTGDYQISVKFKLRLEAGGTVYDVGAACQNIACWSAPGY